MARLSRTRGLAIMLTRQQLVDQANIEKALVLLSKVKATSFPNAEAVIGATRFITGMRWHREAEEFRKQAALAATGEGE